MSCEFGEAIGVADSLTVEMLQRARHYEPPVGKPFLIVPARLVEATRAFWGSAVDVYEAKRPNF